MRSKGSTSWLENTILVDLANISIFRFHHEVDQQIIIIAILEL